MWTSFVETCSKVCWRVGSLLLVLAIFSGLVLHGEGRVGVLLLDMLLLYAVLPVGVLVALAKAVRGSIDTRAILISAGCIAVNAFEFLSSKSQVQ